MTPEIAPSPLPVLRKLVLGLLVLGLVGTGTELVLLAHYEGSTQLIPIVLIVTALVAIVGHAVAPGWVTVRTIRAVMVFLIGAGVLGVVLHYQGNLEFQLEMDPSLSRWELFMKVIRAHAPPALAPGVMAQLGLLGLAYTYRHPAGGQPGHDA